MATNYDVLGGLRSDWRRISRLESSRGALCRLREHHPHLPLDGVGDLADLLFVLEPRGGRTVEQRAAIIQALLVESSDLELRRALLQTLLPGVVSVCRQLRWGEGIFDDPREVMGEAVSTLDELLAQWAGQSRPYAGPDLLSALRGRLRRWMLKEKASHQQILRHEALESAGEENSPLLTRLESYRGGPHDRLARLTYERVFVGRSLKELASSDRSSPKALQQELQHFALTFLL